MSKQRLLKVTEEDSARPRVPGQTMRLLECAAVLLQAAQTGEGEEDIVLEAENVV